MLKFLMSLSQKKCLENEQLGFQKPYPLPHDDKPMPNFILEMMHLELEHF